MDKFLNHMELVIAGKDNLCLRIRHLFLLAMLVGNEFDGSLCLAHDVALNDGQQHVAAQHVFPQIGRHILVVVARRIARAAHVAGSVAALVEGHEERLFAF